MARKQTAKPKNKQADLEKFAQLMSEYVDYPVDFVKDILKVEPVTWQKETLQAIAKEPRVAVRSGHGVGKTALESWVILWFLFTRPFPKVPCTAPSKPQLMEVLWPEIAKWLEKSAVLKDYFEWQSTKVKNKQYPEQWFATARTANKPENMAGFHADHILFVVDEASGVEDEIYDTIEGALTTDDAKLLLCGNPTRTSGTFYQAFHRDRDLFYTLKVSCMDSPNVKPSYWETMKRKYGEDSDVYRVRVLGDFPKAEPDIFIPLELVEKALITDVKAEGKLQIGVDVARFGDDQNVIAARIGDRLVHLERFNLDRGTSGIMVTAGKVLAAARTLMDKYNKEECTINIDDDGIGGGVTDRLHEVAEEEKLPLNIVDCHNGARPSDDIHYDDWVTETWAHLRDGLKAGRVSFIEVSKDKELVDDLVGQLTTRKYMMTSKGKLKLERKERMKDRGLRSPDIADALALCFREATGISIHSDDPEEDWDDGWVDIFDEGGDFLL